MDKIIRHDDLKHNVANEKSTFGQYYAFLEKYEGVQEQWSVRTLLDVDRLKAFVEYCFKCQKSGQTIANKICRLKRVISLENNNLVDQMAHYAICFCFRLSRNCYKSQEIFETTTFSLEISQRFSIGSKTIWNHWWWEPSKVFVGNLIIFEIISPSWAI